MIPDPDEETRLYDIRDALAGRVPATLAETAYAIDLKFCLDLIEGLIKDRDLYKARARRSWRTRESNRARG